MERQRYPDDLSDEEWSELEPLLRASRGKGGLPPKYGRREILNAIFYVLRTGCSWRHYYDTMKVIKRIELAMTIEWIIYEGKEYQLEWYCDKKGKSQAQEYFEAMSDV